MDLRVFFIIPYVFSAAAIMGTGLYTLLRRDSTGALYLALANFCAGLWSLSEGLLYLGGTLESNILITKFQYLGLVSITPFFFLFIMEVFGLHDYITWKLKFFLMLVTTITLVFAFGYPDITLLWAGHFEVTHGLFPMLAWRHGYYFWIFIGYNYSLLLTSTIILFRALGFADPIMKKRAQVFLVSLFPVWIIQGIYSFGSSPISNVDFGPLAFSITAMAMVYGYYKYNMLDLFPAAKKALYSHMNELLFILDPKDRVVEINPAAASLLNIKETWAVGRSVHEVLQNWPALKERLLKGRGGMIDSAGGLPRGTYDLRLTPLKDRKGRPLGRLATLRDTSTLAPLKSRSHLMAVLDRDLVLVDANEDFLQHSENRQEIFGRRIDGLLNLLNQPDNLKQIEQAFATNQTLSCEFEYNGRVYENRLFPIEEEYGQEARMLCMLKDITEEQVRQKRIMHANKMAAVGRLAAGLAHEIRNPLGLIRNYCFLLKKQFKNQNDTPGLDSLQKIDAAVDQAMRVIEHLLDFSRMPASKDTGCHIGQVIQRVAALASKTATRAGVDISIDCPVGRVEGVSPDSLNIITANLLANALEAMPAGGKCCLKGRIEDRQVKIVVSDTGPGIETHHLDQIFEPFFSTKQREKGTGLGLYIVYNEVQKYGGSIFPESTLDQGTSFTIVIPLKNQEIEHDPTPI